MRAHLNKSIIRKTSGLPADGTCQVYEAGTTTPLAQTIYIGDTGAPTRANPFTFTAGVIDFYLDVPQRVKLVVTPSGGAAQTFDDVDVVTPTASLLLLSGGTLTAPSAASIPLKIKLAAAQSANAFEVRDSADALMTRITSAGGVVAPLVIAGAGTDPGSGTLRVASASAGDKGIVIRAGSATPTADGLQYQQGTTGAVLAYIGPDGQVGGRTLNAVGTLGARLNVMSDGTGEVLARFKGFAGQTGNYLEMQNSASTSLVVVGAAGGLTAGDISSYAFSGISNGSIVAVNRNQNGSTPVPGPLIMSEGLAWNSTYGITIKRAGFKVMTSVNNINPPVVRLAFMVNKPGPYDNPAVEVGSIDSNGQTYFTTALAKYHALDFDGNGVPNTYIRVFTADGSQISFQSDPFGDTGYKTIRASGYSTVSTMDSKTNVQDLPDGDSLMSVLRIARPVRYQPRDAPLGELRDGLIAEDFADVYPQAVTTTPTGVPTGIDYGALTPLIIGGVQELDRRITELERQLASRP